MTSPNTIIADLQAENETLRARLAELEKQEPVCWMTPSGEGWMMRTEPPVTDTKLGWTTMFAAPVVSPDVEKLKAENQSLKNEAAFWKQETKTWADKHDELAESFQCHPNKPVIERLKTEFESVRKDAEWQPIETAPKDGSVIVLGARNGVWLGKYKPVYQSGFRPENPWRSMMLNHDHMAKRHTRPTHWKPLPAPPAIEQASSCNELHEKGGV